MSEQLRDAIDNIESWEDVDYAEVDISDIQDVYADYISADIY